MRTLGMIGGTSWYSTLEYYKGINQLVAERIGKQSNPELILHSISIEIMRRHDKEEIKSKYLEVAQKLEKDSAEAIIICANTPHMVYDFVQPQISIPILHIAEATGIAASKKRLKILGLLGNRPTMTGQVIPSVLEEKYDIQTVIPDEEYLARSHDYVSKELTQGTFSDEAKHFFIEQSELLQQKGAQGIILGCTELPILLKDTRLNLPSLPTTDLHIQMAVDFILEVKE